MKRYVRVSVCAWVMAFAVTLSCRAQNIPVDPLTGRANISIPIWELQEGNLSVPIVVAYNGGGVRVTEGEGSAGMSWNLIADGSVYRELRGLPDDYTKSGDSRKGWLYDSNGHNVNVFVPTGTSCSTEGTDYTFINGLANSFKDTEPDHFYFNAPGLSGRFVFGGDGALKTIPYQDLKFEITRADSGTGAIEQIKITNNVGVVYTFSAKQAVKRTAFQLRTVPIKFFTTDWNLYNSPVAYTSAWKLNSIVSATGAAIEFYYGSSEPGMSVQKITTISETGKEYERYRIKEETEGSLRISSTTTNSTRAIFTWDQNRVSNILIKDIAESNFEKGFNFVYEAVRDVSSPAWATVWRSFLSEVRREEKCETLPSYKFSYEYIDFNTHSAPHSFGDQNEQDYWGYHNGTAETRIPTIYHYSAQANAERFRLSSIPGQSPTQTFTGANRAVDTTLVVSGSLASISYPTGATAHITFEANRYYDAIASQSVFGGGVRVKSVLVTGVGKGSQNLQTNYEYKLANNTTSGKIVYRPVFVFAGGDSVYRSPDNLAPDGGVFYTRSTMKQTGKGKTVYDFIYPGVYPETSYSSDWSAALTRTARPISCQSIGNQEVGHYRYPFAPSTNYDFEQGLTKRVTDYAEGGTVIVRQKSYIYQRLATTAVSIKGLRYEKMPDGNFIYSQYTVLANLNNVLVTDTTRIADEVTPTNKIQTISKYVYNPTHHMLDSTWFANSTGIIYSTKYRYAKDYAALTNPNTAKPHAVAMKVLNTNFRHGELIEVTKGRKDGAVFQVIRASLSLYRDFGTGRTLLDSIMEFPQTTGFTKPFITGTPQRLAYASAYRTMSIIQSYNSVGLPLSVIDSRKKKSGIHYGYGHTTPVATVTNAYAEETVYSGFETTSSFSLDVIGGGTSNVPGWAGSSAKSIQASTVLRRYKIQKGVGKYRFSCWVRSSATPTITFKVKDSTLVKATGTITYGGAGQWQYLEALLDMSLATPVFSLEVVSSTSAELDEVRFYPAIATMTTSTAQPLTGTTSVSDDRGVSSFQEYDNLGRVHYVEDRNKNIVQVKDYRFRNETPPPLSSNFTTDETKPVRNEVVHFTAPLNCGVVNYTWKVNGTQVGTNSSLTHTFLTHAYNAVELTVSTNAGSVSTTKSYCVEPGIGGISFTAENITIKKCDASQWRTVTANTVIGCDLHHPLSPTTGFTWYIKPLSSGVWIEISHDLDDNYSNETVTYSITDLGFVAQEYSIKCVVSPGCKVTNSPDQRCNQVYEFLAEGVVDYHYVNNGPCL